MVWGFIKSLFLSVGLSKLMEIYDIDEQSGFSGSVIVIRNFGLMRRCPEPYQFPKHDISVYLHQIIR